jgi:hypothetical protein
MSKGRISAVFDSSVSKERIMAASGESWWHNDENGSENHD